MTTTSAAESTTFEPMRLESIRYFQGCSYGLREKTALAEVAVPSDIIYDPQIEQRFRAGVLGLCPEEPLFEVSESDWPQTFHMPDFIAAGADDPARWLANWIVAVTVAIERWGRDPVFDGRVVSAQPHRLQLALPWQRQNFCRESLNLALSLLGSWIDPGPEQISKQLQQWLRPTTETVPVKRLSANFRQDWADIQANGLAPNSFRFFQSGMKRGWPVDILPSFVQFGWGANLERMDMSFSGRTPWIGHALVKNKWKGNRTLSAAGLPVPAGELVATAEQAEQAANRLGWPVVAKPLNQDQGLGVTPGIRDVETLRTAFNEANNYSSGRVLVEKHIDGWVHRLLVVHGRLIAAARITPPSVTGDGSHTVAQLVDIANANPLRGTSGHSMMKKLVLNDIAETVLAEQGLSRDSVPEATRVVLLSHSGSINFGGTAVDVTDEVHPDNRMLAERATRISGLDISGVDVICPDIRRSWREVGGVINEVNAQPGFRVHWLADPERDINGDVLDLLFSDRPPRIPTAAITGTRGDSSVAVLLHRILRAAGLFAGVCTPASVIIGDDLVTYENLAGFTGVKMILNDPGSQAGVFEMPPRSLLESGHPCDLYDVGAILGVDDHAGVGGIDTPQRMAEVEAEVLERATAAVVVNADDPLCMSVLSRAAAPRRILVSRDAATVADHRSGGGEAVFADKRRRKNVVVVASGDAETVVIPADGIPEDRLGAAMFAAAIATAHGIDPTVIGDTVSSVSG